MDENNAQLREANRALGELLGSPEGRAVLRNNGYDSSRRIKPILESQPVDDLIEDIHRNGAAVYAIYYPRLTGMDQFQILEFDELACPDGADSETENAVTPGRSSQEMLATVGMLVDALGGGGRLDGTTFDLPRSFPLERPRVFSMS